MENAIKNDFRMKFIIDELPIWGKIGEQFDSEVQLYTHYAFTISFNGQHIISANMTSLEPVTMKEGINIRFSYSFSWDKTNVPYENRIKLLYDESFYKNPVHKYSIINSGILVLLLIILMCVTLNRMLKRDYNRFIQEASLDGFEIDTNEQGWKALHGDVFRPPKYSLLLSVLAGNGTQIAFALVFISMINYKISDSVITVPRNIFSYFAYLVLSPINGFIVNSLTKTYQIEFDTFLIALVTSLLVPIYCFGNAFVYFTVSSISGLAYSFPIFYCILILLKGIAGQYAATVIGFINPEGCIHNGNENVAISKIPRDIPKLPWWLNKLIICTVIGLITTASAIVELWYLLSSIWQHNICFIWSYFLLSIILVIAVSICTTILMVYILLQYENHNWQWISFMAPASTGVYIFIYSVYYYCTKTQMHGLFQFYSFFLIMGSISLTTSLLCGGASHFASNIFVHRIFNNLKVD